MNMIDSECQIEVLRVYLLSLIIYNRWLFVIFLVNRWIRVIVGIFRFV